MPLLLWRFMKCNVQNHISLPAPQRPYAQNLSHGLLVLFQGAGGVITDWSGDALTWKVEGSDIAAAVKAAPGEVLAAGDARTHKQVLDMLDWKGTQ